MTKASKNRRKAYRKEPLATRRELQANPPPAPPPPPANGPRPHAPKGTRVAIIREEHGWHDGQTEGVLIDDHGTVRTAEGYTYECRKRRDYYVID